MADKPIPPINANAPIVEMSGKPKPFFVLLINQLLKSSVASALAIAQQALDAVNALIPRVDDLEDVDIIAGVALDGGGMLGDGDVTIDHADSAVTPGVYGDDTHVAVITVDQQGHVTNVEAVEITGGGGGGGVGRVGAQFWGISGVQLGTTLPAGFGYTNVQWLSGGSPLTPTVVGATDTDTGGGWSAAEAFNGSTASGNGWYSGDSNFHPTNPILWADFGYGVFPDQVSFAPLNGYAWTIGQQTSWVYSQDGETWKLLARIICRAGADNVNETYDLPLSVVEDVPLPPSATVRGHGQGAVNTSNFNVAFPAASQAGDDCFIFLSGNWGLASTPTGWTNIGSATGSGGSPTIGNILYRNLDSTDISTGFVTCSSGHNESTSWCIATMVGAVTIRQTSVPADSVVLGSSVSNLGTVPISSDANVLTNDFALLFCADRNFSDNVYDIGTEIEHLSTGVGTSCSLSTYSVPADGSFTATASYLWGGSCFQAIVVFEG